VSKRHPETKKDKRKWFIRAFMKRRTVGMDRQAKGWMRRRRRRRRRRRGGLV